MAERPAKLRRLAAAGAAYSRLTRVLDLLREEPLEAPVSRAGLQRSLEALWKDVGQPERLNTSGEPFDWQCVSFPKLLKFFVEESAPFQTLLRQTWEASPSTEASPWHLVVYGDEVVPGNVLRLDNRRKVFCIYVSIREFAGAHLKKETLWFPIAAVRSSQAKRINGGISACVRALLHRFFSHDQLHCRGVCLDLGIPGSRYATLFFRLGNLVADGDALRAVLSAKGASGKLPCILCKNVLSKHRGSNYLVHFSCTDPNLFDLATNEEIWAKADALHGAAGAISKRQFEELQTATGLTYCPDGLLWDLTLRRHFLPTSSITYDSMHCFVSNGIVQHETSLVIAALKDHGISWSMLRDFCEADWSFCKALGSRSLLQGCFATPREQAFRSDSTFKAGASEMLLVAPVLLYFLQKIVQPSGRMDPQVRSYAALCEILAMVCLGKDGRAVHRELKVGIRRHAELFTAAYPEAEMRPKNHWVHHIPGQLARDHIVIDAFVGERKHSTMKEIAFDLNNTRAFEKSLLSRAVARQAEVLRLPFADGLVSPKPCPELVDAAGRANVSTFLRWKGTRIAIGDCIRFNEQICIVRVCCELGDDLCLIVDTYNFAGADTPSAGRWQKSAEDVIAKLAEGDLRLVPAWFQGADGALACCS